MEVLADGDFDAVIYYTCAPENLGSTLRLTFGESSIQAKFSEAFDPPLRGREHDRAERIESYVKDWKTMNLGKIQLKKGKGSMTLQADQIAGKQVMDFRLMMPERVN